MGTLRRVALGTAVAVGVIAPCSARAQLAGSVVFTPFIAAYTPTSDLAKTGTSASMKQAASPALGATAAYWLNDRAAIEGGLIYSRSDLKESAGDVLGRPSASTLGHANVLLVSTRLMIQVLPPTSPFNLRFGAGPALIARGGKAFQEIDGKDTGLTDVGADLSLCTRFSLTPRAAIRLRGEDFIYRAKLGYENSANPSANYSFGARTQHDFVFSAGLQLFVQR